MIKKFLATTALLFSFSTLAQHTLDTSLAQAEFGSCFRLVETEPLFLKPPETICIHSAEIKTDLSRAAIFLTVSSDLSRTISQYEATEGAEGNLTLDRVIFASADSAGDCDTAKNVLVKLSLNLGAEGNLSINSLKAVSNYTYDNCHSEVETRTAEYLELR